MNRHLIRPLDGLQLVLNEELNLRLAVFGEEFALQLRLDEVSDGHENSMVRLEEFVAAFGSQRKLKVKLADASSDFCARRQYLESLIQERDRLVHGIVKRVEHAGVFVGNLHSNKSFAVYNQSVDLRFGRCVHHGSSFQQVALMVRFVRFLQTNVEGDAHDWIFSF